MAVSNADLHNTLFIPLGGNKFQCRLCPKTRNGNTNGGYSNTVGHLKTAHAGTFLDEYHSLVTPAPTLDNFVSSVDHAASTTYGWLDWIIIEHRELSFCDKKRTRKYSSLDSICSKTLKERMEGVEDVVRDRIRFRLKDKLLGLLFDAWTDAGTHYVAVIGVTPNKTDAIVADKYLLCFTPFRDETSMNADAFVELFDHVLDLYHIQASQLCFVT